MLNCLVHPPSICIRSAGRPRHTHKDSNADNGERYCFLHRSTPDVVQLLQSSVRRFRPHIKSLSIPACESFVQRVAAMPYFEPFREVPSVLKHPRHHGKIVRAGRSETLMASLAQQFIVQLYEHRLKSLKSEVRVCARGMKNQWAWCVVVR